MKEGTRKGWDFPCPIRESALQIKSRRGIGPADAKDQDMSKHTPGPWKIVEGHEHSEACPLNIHSAEGHEVCAVVGQGEYLLDPPTEEGLANARLLAAAPHLLWLAQRARDIRNAKGWTKAERERSWAAWDEQLNSAVKEIDGLA